MRIKALAYSVIDSTNMDAWRKFGEEVAGFCAHAVPGGLALRIDERAGRLFIVPAQADRYAASGWEVPSEADVALAKTELDAHGVAFQQATAAEIALRHVFDMVWLRDPSGNRHELALGYAASFERFV